MMQRGTHYDYLQNYEHVAITAWKNAFMIAMILFP